MDKKEFKKAFDGLTEDVLDNYSKYKIEHKIMVKEQLERFNKLNEFLRIYDDKRQKEEIKKELDKLRDELSNRFEEYIPAHKDMVIKELSNYESLNKILDEYDNTERIIEKKKSLWELLKQALGIK